ncbi:MAG: PQQ-binding-like beta-propeller repeat protein, partial [Candidatus Omnitrophica bacterium]|nr:PQQ-binding-like beta-propeller repeat protein [Candidatus Omnitrophota bacterium]
MRSFQPVTILFQSFILASLFTLAPSNPSIAGDIEDTAFNLVEEAELWTGLVSIVGSEPGGQMGLALANDDFVVHVLEPNPELVDPVQELVDRDGVYGKSLVVEAGGLNPLPYVGNSIDLLVCLNLTQRMEELSGKEVIRVLRPGGIAILGEATSEEAFSPACMDWFSKVFAADPQKVKTKSGAWLKFQKPEMEGTDDWSHWEHTPDNNPLSADQNTEPPFMTQFLGAPYYIAMPAITTAAGGRTFLAMGHIAHHEREEEWLNTLVARNGYNGLELWRRKLPDGYMVHRSAFIATDDIFYMIDPNGSGVLMLDPESGDELGRVRIRGERGEWKWIALQDGVLYGLIGGEKDPSETTIVRSNQSHWSWDELSRGYYEKRVPWGFGETLVAYDLNGNDVKWKYETDNQIDSRAIAIGGGKVFYYGPDLHIGALDINSGLKLWSNNDSEIINLIEEPGRGLTSTPGFKSACYLVYSPKALFFQGQTRMNVVAVSPQDGSLMWRRKKVTNNPNTLYVNGDLFVGIGEEGETLKLNPETGDTLKEMGFGKRSCARLTGTPYQLFCRAEPEGSVFYDRIQDKVRYNGAFRPACNDGVIGANGLLYIGPWLCDCNLSLMGSAALTSAGDFVFSVSPEGRLTKGNAYDREIQAGQEDPSDWSQYRGNVKRTGTTPVWLRGGIDLVWQYQPEFEFEPTAPVSAGGRFFYAGDDGKVRCVNAFTGEMEWIYRTAGPIKAAPSVWEGRVYVGSGDGHVYCLTANTGELIWKFKAAPVGRRMMVYDRLASTWPVNTGVLIHEGKTYFGAGIIDYDGTYVYALDAKTGEVRWLNDKTGHLDEDSRKGVSAQGFLTVADGKLWMAGGNVLSPVAYDLETGEYLGKQPGDGTPDANRGEEIGVYKNKYIIQGGRLQYSAAKNVVNPGYFAAFSMNGSEIPGPERRLNQGKIPPVWDDYGLYFTDGINLPPTYWSSEDLLKYLETGRSSDVPVPKWTVTQLNNSDTVSLALAGDYLVTVNESPTPRSLVSTWTVSGINPENGRVDWKTWLEKPAVPGALLIDREGRVLVAHEGGGLSCLGGDGAIKSYINYLVKEMEKSGDGKERITNLLNDSLAKINTEGARNLIIDMMKDNGIVVGKEAKENGAVIEWHLTSPLPFNEEHRFDEAFVSPATPDLTAPITVDDATHAWRTYTTIDRDGMIDLAEIYGRLEDSAVLAYAEIDLKEDRDLALYVGSNDGFLLWFNGEEAGRYESG